MFTNLVTFAQQIFSFSHSHPRRHEKFIHQSSSILFGREG